MWKSLSTEAQTTWVNILEADCCIILGNVKSSKPPKLAKLPSSSSVPSSSSFLHAIDEKPNDEVTDTELTTANDDAPKETSTDLLAMVTKCQRHLSIIPPPSDARRRLSMPSSNEPDEIKVGGKVYRKVNATILYSVFASNHKQVSSSLVDRGANGGIAGDNVRIIGNTL
jgi:hypothetical protein